MFVLCVIVEPQLVNDLERMIDDLLLEEDNNAPRNGENGINAPRDNNIPLHPQNILRPPAWNYNPQDHFWQALDPYHPENPALGNHYQRNFAPGYPDLLEGGINGRQCKMNKFLTIHNSEYIISFPLLFSCFSFSR